MGMQVYQKEQYKVYRAGNGYIVHNSYYEFKEKHNHINNFKTAEKLIHCVINGEIPRSFNCYLLRSLIRISDDVEYIMSWMITK